MTDDVDTQVGAVDRQDIVANAHVDAEPNNSYLDVMGMDATCLMSLEEKIKDWPNAKDSDIARQIFSTYNLTPQVDDTDVNIVTPIIDPTASVPGAPLLAQVLNGDLKVGDELIIRSVAAKSQLPGAIRR